jgi:hypothetical protein
LNGNGTQTLKPQLETFDWLASREQQVFEYQVTMISNFKPFKIFLGNFMPDMMPAAPWS